MMENRKSFLSFAVAVALSCYGHEIDYDKLTPQMAAELVRWVLKIAFGPAVDGLDVVAIGYPPAAKIPLRVSVPGMADQLIWFYPQLSFEQMRDELCDRPAELPIPAFSAIA